MSGNLTLRRPISTWWWLRKRTYFVFVMRELSSQCYWLIQAILFELHLSC